MEIILASKQLVQDIMEIISACTAHMESLGIYQWHDNYPTESVVRNDIGKGQLYCILHEDRCVAIITLNEEQDIEYREIKWLTKDGKNLVVHRLAVHPDHQGCGLAKKLMEFAEDLAARQGYDSIRLDTYSANERNQRFYEKADYIRLGQVNLPYRPLPYFCYEKVFPKS